MAMWGYGYGGPMMGYGGYGASHFLFSLCWIILLVAAIVIAVRWVRAGKPLLPHHGNRALDILKERYARGEVSRQEFEEKKKDLTD